MREERFLRKENLYSKKERHQNRSNQVYYNNRTMHFALMVVPHKFSFEVSRILDFVWVDCYDPIRSAQLYAVESIFRRVLVHTVNLALQ